MSVDLTKKPGSVSYEYLQILGKLYEIQSKTDLSSQDKRDECLLVAIGALNRVSHISTNTYDRKRIELMSAKTDNDLIRVVERTIENGKNYEGE